MLEYGDDFAQSCQFGRICSIKNCFYAGEMSLNDNGNYQLDGFGQYIDEKSYEKGVFKNHDLHGIAYRVHCDGRVEEGRFIYEITKNINATCIPKRHLRFQMCIRNN